MITTRRLSFMLSEGLAPGRSEHTRKLPFGPKIAAYPRRPSARCRTEQLETSHVPRTAVDTNGEPRFPALQDAITREWQAQSTHRAAGDAKLDRAVLHVQNDLPFTEIVALLDALHAPRRGNASAFNVTLSTQ